MLTPRQADEAEEKEKRQLEFAHVDVLAQALSMSLCTVSIAPAAS